MPNHDAFESPFATRYGSEAMRQIWSERNKRLLWRKMWVALARKQHALGIVTQAQLDDIVAHAEDVSDASIARALAIEAEIHHDLMAEVRAFAEQCAVGGGVIHLGATSMDIEDNADVLRMRDALDLVRAQLSFLNKALADKVERYADVPTMAFTHLQPAEPTTLGHRLALYLQDLMHDGDLLYFVRVRLRAKGFRGAVGTSASYLELASGEATEWESSGDELGLGEFDVVSQTYPRKQDWLVVTALAGVAQSLHKFALDLRVLQSPPIGELSEPFGAQQVGSSAMPFKRNPILAEKIDSLARYVATLPRALWDNAALSMLERTLDDSANRRVVLAEAFLATDEILRTATRIATDLRVNEAQIARNMATYGPFAATERLLMALVRAGANRQDMHERIRQHSLRAWAAIADGAPNPLVELVCGDEVIAQFVAPDDARRLMDASAYVGDAPQRARALAAKSRQ